jgi:hypothetical protein
MSIYDGFAQVFDLRQYNNQILRSAYMRQQRKAQEEKEAREYLAKFSPEGMRTQDLKEFQDTYKKLQGIYINNPGLYTNPMQNVDLYKQASELASNLKMMISDSKEQKQSMEEIAKARLSNKGSISASAWDKVRAFDQLPTSRIKDSNNGRLFGAADVEINPKPIDWEKLRPEFELVSDAAGESVQDFITLKHDGGNNGVPQGKIATKTVKQLGEMAIAKVVTRQFNTDPEFEDTITHAFNQAQEGGGLDQMQQQLDSHLREKTFAIDSPEDFGTAMAILQFSRVEDDFKLSDDQEWLRKNKVSDDLRDFEQSKYLKQMEIDAADKRQRRAIAAADARAKDGGQQSEDDQLMEFSRQLHTVLGSSGNDMSQIKQFANPIFKSGLTFAKQPEIHGKVDGRGKVKTKEQFRKEITKLNKEAMNPIMVLNDKEIDYLYDNNINIMSMTIKDDKSRKLKTAIINPLKASSPGMLHQFLKAARTGDRKHGVE